MIYIPLPLIHYPLPITPYPLSITHYPLSITRMGVQVQVQVVCTYIYIAHARAREKKRFFCDHLSAMTGDFSFFDDFFILQKKMSIFATDEKK